MTDQEKDKLAELVDRHVNQLGEHFDVIRIFCSTGTNDGKATTFHYTTGHGNWYAQYGHIRSWIIRKEEEERAEEREDRD